MTDPITIRPCRREEWPAFAECVYAMWRDIGTAPQEIKDDWREEILRFIETAAETAQFQGCVAVAGDRIVGSAGGQLWMRPVAANLPSRRTGCAATFGASMWPRSIGAGASGRR